MVGKKVGNIFTKGVKIKKKWAGNYNKQCWKLQKKSGWNTYFTKNGGNFHQKNSRKKITGKYLKWRKSEKFEKLSEN